MSIALPRFVCFLCLGVYLDSLAHKYLSEVLLTFSAHSCVHCLATATAALKPFPIRSEGTVCSINTLWHFLLQTTGRLLPRPLQRSSGCWKNPSFPQTGLLAVGQSVELDQIFWLLELYWRSRVFKKGRNGFFFFFFTWSCRHIGCLLKGFDLIAKYLFSYEKVLV